MVYQIELDFLFSIAFCIFSIDINVNHVDVCIYIHTSHILNYFYWSLSVNACYALFFEYWRMLFLKLY